MALFFYCRRAGVRSLMVLIALVGMVSARANGQISDGAGRLSNATAFITVGGENTQFPYYADNAMGFDSGFSYQPRSLVGFEGRVGSYPYSARFVQIPITVGYRIAGNSLFGFSYAPFVYFGAGVSRSQDEGLGRVHTTPVFAACWQVDIGFDRNYKSFSWRMVQVSRRETYDRQQSLRSMGLSTGIVYRIKR
jgi:hypothetical protein